MFNNKKLSVLALSSVFISACTQMERFNTEVPLTDVEGKNTAKIKVISNIRDIFAIPNYGCITLDEKAVKKVDAPFINNGSFWSLSFEKPKLEEQKDKSIGMQSVPLEKFNEHKKEFLENTRYHSYEYQVEADKPITFFIKTSNWDLVSYVALLARDQKELFSLATSFMPQKDKEYQLFILKKNHSYYISPTTQRTNVTYSFNIFDITNGDIKINNQMMNESKACNSK